MSAPRLSIPISGLTCNPSHFTIRNAGIIVTWNGTIKVASSRMKTRFFPAKLIRANAYPARLQKTRFPATTVTATIVELMKKRPKGAASNAFG